MKKFTRTKEDFVCDHCGASIKGTGYTNHCPNCLWSKHVDINPGDRLNSCQGMMRPVRLELDHGEQALIHKCEKCAKIMRNKTTLNDSANALIGLAKSVAKI